ncbi:hypothetical protein VFC2026_10860 [Listeria monocytogenes]|jgi:hypothetical protein
MTYGCKRKNRIKDKQMAEKELHLVVYFSDNKSNAVIVAARMTGGFAPVRIT